GQLYGFLGKERQAEAEVQFRKALKHFTDPVDRDRQWINLGHLACEQGKPQGCRLWGEVGSHFPSLAPDRPIIEDGKQYLLALQLKGALVFNCPDRGKLSNQWTQQSDPCKRYPFSKRQVHPFGLIYQAVALNYARLWQGGNSQATYQGLALY